MEGIEGQTDNRDEVAPTSTVSGHNEKGEIVRSGAITTEVSDGEPVITQQIQDLADESENGLNPDKFTGDLKVAVEKSVNESEVANDAREKLRQNLDASSSALPPFKIVDK